MAYSHWKLEGRLVRALIEKSGDTVAWLESVGVAFIGVIHHVPNQSPEVFHIVAPPTNTGRAVTDALVARLGPLGVACMTGTRAGSLVLEGGRVAGVRAQRNGEALSAGAVCRPGPAGAADPAGGHRGTASGRSHKGGPGRPVPPGRKPRGGPPRS